MYYLLVRQKMNNIFVNRSIITVANKECFADLEDENPSFIPPRVVMGKDTFEEILKNGYQTKEDAANDKEMAKALRDYIGPWFQVEYKTIDENELNEIYKTICSR